MNSKTLLLGLVLVAAAGALLWFRSDSNAERGTAGAGPTFTATAPPSPPSLQAPVEITRDALAQPSNSPPPAPEPEAATTAKYGTAESVLAEYYGADWERVRPLVQKRILKLDLPLTAPFVPWEKVLPEVCSRMRVDDVTYSSWHSMFGVPRPVTIAYLVDNLGGEEVPIDEHDVAAVETLLAETRTAIDDKSAQLRGVIDSVLSQKCQLGQYNYGPFADIDTRCTPKRAVYADGTAISGWALSWGVAEDEHPELAGLRKDVAELKKRARQIVAAYLQEKKGG